ncbi:MAG: ABC-F family ATP-binding cassette domain-containing protein [Acetatifactor sp.]|nr:ABC-F family ATP-binding cassette domain-containing protein [Acetatifactor sp.]
MNLLTAENLTKSFGLRKVLAGVNFSMQEGEKVGVIGINGTGKSTLLRILAGLEEPDEGRIIKANHLKVGFLSQNPEFIPGETVLEAVLRVAQTETNREFIETEAKSMLTRLGVTEFEEICDRLSGGQRKRLALVAALLSDADLLILDEPTNHLDSEMSGWLEENLRSRKGAVLMVTHDRYFLDSVANRIIEIDKGAVYSYNTNYAGFLERKLQREEMALSSEKKRQNILRNELKWVQRGAQARTTKQKARLERFEELKNGDAPVTDSRVELSSALSRLGRTTVELEGVTKSFGDKCLVRDFTYLFGKDDRVGFVGRNGSGKTTLMRMITGEEKPDCGTVTLGQTVKIGYYSQEIGQEEMPADKRVIDYIRDVAEFVDTADGKVSAARMLERFLFAGEDQYGLLGKLSGGERRRLYLCKVLMGSPNVLILDEPTNDLDIATLQTLEDYLDSFRGIVIAVSHDRYFLDRTVHRIFALEEGGHVSRYEGGYTDYRQKADQKDVLEKTAAESPAGESSAARKNWKSGQTKKLKFSYQEQKEYETIEAQIAGLEEKIKILEDDILRNARDFAKLNELTAEKERTEQLLEEKMDRWMYLEDLAARIEQGETYTV